MSFNLSTLINQLLETELFEELEPPLRNYLDLKSTLYQIYISQGEGIIWYLLLKKDKMSRRYLPIDKEVSFEEVLRTVPVSVQEKLIFHLDLFT